MSEVRQTAERGVAVRQIALLSSLATGEGLQTDLGPGEFALRQRAALEGWPFRWRVGQDGRLERAYIQECLPGDIQDAINRAIDKLELAGHFDNEDRQARQTGGQERLSHQHEDVSQQEGRTA